MRLLFSIIAGLFSALVALVTGPVLLTSAWLDLTADRTHPDASRLYRVYGDFAPELAAFATRPDMQFLILDRSLATLAVGEGIVSATSVSQVESLTALDPDRPIPNLTVLAVDPNFPSFFEVRWAGQRLDEFGMEPQLWLTETSAGRLRRALGAMPREFVVNGQVLSVRGVVSDPPAGSHLDYDALVSGRLTSSQVSGVLYVKSDDPEAAAARLGPLISQSIGFPAMIMRARLAPVSRLRLASFEQQFEPAFVSTGRGLEFAVAFSSGVATVLGGILALMLLVNSMMERRRQALGLRVMLGRSPARMALSALSRFALVLVVILPVTFWLAWTYGAGVLQALEKPDMPALSGALILLSLVVAGLVLAGAALALSGLFMTSPAQLALPGRAQSVRAATALIIGLAGLSAGTGLLMFSASQFATEVRLGARLSPDADRIWLLRPGSPAELNRIRFELEDSALVSDVAVLGWRPFDIRRLNAAVSVEGGELIQVTTLSSDTGWSRFWGARQIAGPKGLLDQLEGRTHCIAIADFTAARALMPQDPSGVVGRSLQAGGGGWTCQIGAVIEPTRLDKRVLHGDPVIHMVNAPQVLESRTRQGQRVRHLLIRFRSGVSQTVMQQTVQDLGLRDPPRTLLDIGLAAYERERRVSQIIVGAAILLSIVMLVVSLALALDTLEAQRKPLAVRRALGARPVTLAYGAIRPSVLAVLGSGVFTVFISMLAAPFWRHWAGLGGQQWDMALMSIIAALAISTLPMAAVFLISVLVISTFSPAQLIRDS